MLVRRERIFSRTVAGDWQPYDFGRLDLLGGTKGGGVAKEQQIDRRIIAGNGQQMMVVKRRFIRKRGGLCSAICVRSIFRRGQSSKLFRGKRSS